ncbi:right-handed parallel beta-helix repeat-containing protein [Candidatus Dojkabacteria bacterium]|nr:right-handed parallel beta-helix repeat-containing protein [Candidatus Dojkabacteria bacterium]
MMNKPGKLLIKIILLVLSSAIIGFLIWLLTFSQIKSLLRKDSSDVLGAGSGSTYYVSTGSCVGADCSCANDSNTGLYPDCSSGAGNGPFATIQRAVNVASSDKSIQIRGGTYNQSVSINNKSNLSISNYNGENVIINGTGINFNDWGSLITVENSSTITVNGIRTQNSTWFGFYCANSTSVTFSNGSTYNTKSSGIYAQDCDRITVKGMDVNRAVNGGNQECISIVECTNFEVSYNTVYGGVAQDGGGEGIDIKQGCKNGSVHHNHVYDMTDDVLIYIDAYHILQENIRVYSNFVNCTAGKGEIGIATAAEQSGGVLKDVYIYNNIVRNCDYGGISITEWDPPGGYGYHQNIFIVNNTVYGNGRDWGGGIDVRTGQIVSGSTVTVQNNIASQNYGWQIGVKDSIASKVVTGYNLIDGYKNYKEDGRTEVAPTGTNFSGSPAFINVSTGDFRLQGTSSALDRGLNVSALGISNDYVGTSRPQGSAYDVGAYELIVSTPVVPPENTGTDSGPTIVPNSQPDSQNGESPTEQSDNSSSAEIDSLDGENSSNDDTEGQHNPENDSVSSTGAEKSTLPLTVLGKIPTSIAKYIPVGLFIALCVFLFQVFDISGGYKIIKNFFVNRERKFGSQGSKKDWDWS